MKGKFYAAYGSNMNIAQMSNRCPNAKVFGVGELKNYRLTFRGKNFGVANVERAENVNVPIVLWNITGECEQSLDRYEGYPNLYIKENIEISTGSGPVEALIYIMVSEYETMPAIPHERYFEVIRQGYKDNNIDDEYLLAVKQEYC